MKKYHRNIDKDFLLHSFRVAKIAEQIGIELGLSNDQMERLIIGALVHDVGKLYIPEEIINKPGSLTDEEFSKVRDHSVLGCYSDLADWLNDDEISKVVKYHHERFDGSGYPDGISGKNIPLYARIVAIADSYDAMVSQRVYKSSETHEFAMSEIEKCSGKRYDPEIVDNFVSAMDNAEKVKKLRKSR